MKIYQVILRYQKKGLLNEKVLKAVYSVNTPEEDIAELEELFDIIKSNDEIKEDTILNTYEEYSFLKLKSGRYCLSKIILANEYKEKFICHVLILAEGFFTFYPSEAINSPVFLSENSDIEKYKLTVLENIPLSGEYAYRTVSEHLKSNNFKTTREILKSVVDYKENLQDIIIIDRSKNMPMTIASVQMSFPIENSHSITFSTIKLNNKDKIMLNCFYDTQSISSDFSLSRRIFNLKIGIMPQNLNNYKFLRVVETGYFVSGQILSAFHRYLSQYDYKDIDSRIEDAYNLFIIFNTDSEVFNSREVKRAFEFVLSSSSKDMLEYLFEKLEPMIARIVKMADFDGIMLIAEFLLKVALSSDKPVTILMAGKALLNIIDHIIFDRKDMTISNSYELYNFLREKMKDNPHIFLRDSVTQERISYINTLMNHDPSGERSLFYLDIILKALVELGYTWPQVIGIENVEVFFDTCVSQISADNLKAFDILKTTSQNADIFSHIIILFFNRMQSESGIPPFAGMFSEILGGIDTEIAAEIRKKVNSLGGGRLLFEEYKNGVERIFEKPESSEDTKAEIPHLLDGAKEASAVILQEQFPDEVILKNDQEKLIDYFNDYFKSVFSIILDYYKNYFSEALKIYISKLENEYKYSECVRLINELSCNGISVDDDAAAFLVKGFEEGARIDNIDEELQKMFIEVKKLKKTRNITSYPDITAMIDFVMWLKQNTNAEYTIDEILNERLDIDKLDESRRCKYIQWCLPEVLNFAKTAEDHKKIIHYFQREDEEEFFDEYLSIIINLIDRNREKGMRVLRGFVVYFFFYLETSYRVLGEEAIIAKVRQSIIHIFTSYPRSFLKEFDYLIKKEFSERGLSMPVQWSQIVNEIGSAPETSFFSKISKIFKK